MPATTSPALRRPLVISNPVAELNDITATRSSGSHPRDRNMLAARLARPFSEAKSMVRPWKTTAGLSGLVAAWPARMSMSAIDLMLARRGRCSKALSVGLQPERGGGRGDAACDNHAIAHAAAGQRPGLERRPVVVVDLRGQRRIFLQDRGRRVSDGCDGRWLARVVSPQVDPGQRT